MTSDNEIKDIIDKLIANQKVVELVKMMQPVDIVAVISTDLGLQSQSASSVVSNLLRRIEGVASPAIETNKQYPVPSVIRRDNNVDEDFVNNLGQTAPEMNPDEFPPEPRKKPGEWPYDAMTTAAMSPKNKGRRRGMIDSKTPGENPFNANLKKRLQPGGDYGGSQGIYSRNSPHFDNPDSSSGRSYDAKGKPGWSSSPPGKQFDLPIDPDDMPHQRETLTDKDLEKVFGNPPVGAPIPKFTLGHGEPRKNGERTGFRRR